MKHIRIVGLIVLVLGIACYAGAFIFLAMGPGTPPFELEANAFAGLKNALMIGGLLLTVSAGIVLAVDRFSFA